MTAHPTAAVRVVAGVHPVREVLRSGQVLDRVLVAEGRERGGAVAEIAELAGGAGVPLRQVPRSQLDALAEGVVHQGVVATGPPLPEADLEDVLAAARASGVRPLLVVLDGVTDPQNLGSIARTAEAVGAHALVVPRRRTAALGAAAEKAAAGAFAYLPLVRVGNLARTLTRLHEAGVWSLGLDGAAEAELADHPLAGEACALVVGAEGHGLSRLLRERCDALVRLPMLGRVGSLNASVAAGVALYTLLDRRAERR